MGWNSWDCFGTTLTEAQAKLQAECDGGEAETIRLDVLYRGHPMV